MGTTEVGAVMTTDVVTAARGTPLRDVVRALGEHRVGGLPVTDAEEDRVIGVVSTSDLGGTRPHAAGRRTARPAPGGSVFSAGCPAFAGPAPRAT